MKLSGNDDDDGWRDSKCRSHPLINGCDKNHNLIQIHYIIIELCKFDYNIVDYNRSSKNVFIVF